ncbi:hypothetical protein MKS88_003083 [Plasmodium brasilianum]|uniref:Uncharacterized protein n=1 Tax=Plasmodium brasilianum TaxID=5824 RepID=A0ACB9Y766_PLABR|nr:hypothetical protein MKS88_003083 [Plasmodium brasilianum]
MFYFKLFFEKTCFTKFNNNTSSFSNGKGRNELSYIKRFLEEKELRKNMPWNEMQNRKLFIRNLLEEEDLEEQFSKETLLHGNKCQNKISDFFINDSDLDLTASESSLDEGSCIFSSNNNMANEVNFKDSYILGQEKTYNTKRKSSIQKYYLYFPVIPLFLFVIGFIIFSSKVSDIGGSIYILYLSLILLPLTILTLRYQGRTFRNISGKIPKDKKEYNTEESFSETCKKHLIKYLYNV